MGEKRKFIKKAVYICLSVLMLLCTETFFLTETRAEEPSAVRTEEEILEGIRGRRDSVVHVESICWDGEEKILDTRSFSGFVASGEVSGVYIVTVRNGLTYTSEEKEALRKKYKLEDNVRISEKTEVVFGGDLRIKAEIAGESQQRNLAVLKLGQAVNFENTLPFAREDVSDKERVFLLSYPETEEQNQETYNEQNQETYNEENVNITEGTVQGIYVEDEITFYKHDIRTDGQSPGGLLLNEDGCAAGLLLTSRGEEEGTALSISSLKSFLDTFKISYREQEPPAEQKKFPVVNIVLGIAAVVLLAAVIAGQLRIRRLREKAADNGGAAKTKVRAVLQYPSENREASVEKRVFIIGRGGDADFVLPEGRGISRRHACIRSDGKNFYLTDMKSTNHTFLNGSKLNADENRILKDGDEILAGKEKLIFRMGK